MYGNAENQIHTRGLVKAPSPESKPTPMWPLLPCLRTDDD